MLQLKKSYKNKIIILTIATLLLIPQNSLAAFTDVPSNHIHKNAIDFLESEGLTKGYDDGTFRPDQKLSKAEFLTFILNATGNADEYDAKTIKTFPDVPQNVWFYGAVETAFQMGLIEKKEENSKFSPELGVNKARALSLLLKLYNIKLEETTSNEKLFQDIPSTHKLAKLAKTAKKYGVFESENSNYFRPYKVINRGELASYIYRIENFGNTNTFNKKPKTLSNTNLDSSLIKNKEFKILLDVWEHIHGNYLDRSKIKDDRLIEAAIEGMVRELGDPYSSFEAPESANEFVDDLNGNFEGIGVEINRIKNDVVIISVIKGSPAKTAGLQPKDIILKVGGKNISGKSMTDIAKMIRGKVGTKVKLIIKRKGGTKGFEVTRSAINIPEVESEMLENEIGYISISTFSSTVGIEFNQMLRALKDQGAKAWIIDVRNNPGGFLNTAVSILHHFIPKNKTLMTVYAGSGDSLTQYSQGLGTIEEMPMVVLINKGSASASEILAAAVKEHKIATIVGETSFGKGTVQDISYYSDGSFLKLTIAKWLTPTGEDINEIGVKPDVRVKDLNTTKDEQLEKAIEIIKSKL